MGRDQFSYKDPNGVDDTLVIAITERQITITIDRPWAGDSESGFGQTASLDLPREDAIELARKILAFYESESE